MNGVKSEMVPILVQRHIQRVRTEAKVIIDISKMESIQNPAGRLNVIAIIGPGYLENRHYPEALLCEIGVYQGRPWHATNKPASQTHSGESRRIQPRHPWFCLTKEQYLRAAPIIFQEIQNIADKKIDKWKSGGSFRIPIDCKRFYRRRKKLMQYEAFKPVPRGITFSVSKRDIHLLSDIYWAELNLNRILKEQIQRIGKELGRCYLCRHKHGFKRPFLSLKIAQEAQKIMLTPSLKNSDYLLLESLEYLPQKRKHPLFPFLAADILNWDGKIPQEKMLALSALPNPLTRLANIQLRVNNNHSGKHDFVSFIVFYSSQKT